MRGDSAFAELVGEVICVRLNLCNDVQDGMECILVIKWLDGLKLRLEGVMVRKGWVG